VVYRAAATIESAATKAAATKDSGSSAPAVDARAPCCPLPPGAAEAYITSPQAFPDLGLFSLSSLCESDNMLGASRAGAT
jgi:hypothetical protein